MLARPAKHKLVKLAKACFPQPRAEQPFGRGDDSHSGDPGCRPDRRRCARLLLECRPRSAIGVARDARRVGANDTNRDEGAWRRKREQVSSYRFSSPRAGSPFDGSHLWITNDGGNSVTEVDRTGHWCALPAATTDSVARPELAAVRPTQACLTCLKHPARVPERFP